jgi:hypothetical protein
LIQIPSLLKRVALAAWPRPRVASLAQKPWADFVCSTEGKAALPTPLAKLLNDAEYRQAKDLAAVSTDDVVACAQLAKRWIEAHRVSA